MPRVMQSKLVWAVVAMACLGLGACKSKPPEPDASATNTQNTGADSSGVGQATADADGDLPGPLAGMLAKRTVYFDFDSSEIRGEGTEIVAAHASTWRPLRRRVSGWKGTRTSAAPASTTSALASVVRRPCVAHCCCRVQRMRSFPR